MSVTNGEKCGREGWTAPVKVGLEERHHRENRKKRVSGLDLEAGGAVEGFKKKTCFACQSPHPNPVINRNGADEVETKMRNGGC